MIIQIILIFIIFIIWFVYSCVRALYEDKKVNQLKAESVQKARSEYQQLENAIKSSPKMEEFCDFVRTQARTGFLCWIHALWEESYGDRGSDDRFKYIEVGYLDYAPPGTKPNDPISLDAYNACKRRKFFLQAQGEASWSYHEAVALCRVVNGFLRQNSIPDILVDKQHGSGRVDWGRRILPPLELKRPY